MGGARKRDAGKERVWRAAVTRQAQSGLGPREFCRREGLVETSFMWWRREIARRDQEPATLAGATRHSSAKFKRPSIAKPQSNGKPRAALVPLPAFVPVRLEGVLSDERIEVVLPSGVTVRIAEREQSLQMVLAVLETRSC